MTLLRSRLRRIRRPSGVAEWAAALVVAAVAIGFAAELLRALVGVLLSTWWAIPAATATAAAGAFAWGRSRVLAARAAAGRLRALRYTLADLDALTPTQFEMAVRDLMIRDGIPARHVGRRGDRAADVIGRHTATGQVVVVQCKHTTSGGKVGAQVIYQVNGTAGPAHGADVAVVVTNGAFTRDARNQAAAFRIALVDRTNLARWAHYGAALGDLLTLSGRLRGRRYRLRHRAPPRR